MKNPTTLVTSYRNPQPSVTQLFAAARSEACDDMQREHHERARRRSYLDHPEVVSIYKTLAARVTANNKRLDPTTHREIDPPSLTAWTSSVTVALTIRGLDGFKDARLLALLEPLAGEEWTAKTTDWPGGDTPERDYRFERRVSSAPCNARLPAGTQKWFQTHLPWQLTGTLQIEVVVYAYVRSDSPTCRSVVKEIKVREIREEVREIVCED